MGLLNWIGVILAMCVILATTELSVVQVCFVGPVCVLALVFNRRYAVFEWNPNLLLSFIRPSGPAGIDMDAIPLNDSLYELHKPRGNPGLQILFFHGLQPGEYTDAHLSTWKSGDGTTLWPKTWLIEEYSDAHVLTVSYNGGVRRNLQGASRMYIIVENLISDIMQENIGQTPNCPVILVGHSFGGLVIKQLCVQALVALHLQHRSARERAKLEKFLASIKGIFYYGTPHHGSPSIDNLADNSDSPLLKYFKTLSTETEELNFLFNKLRASYPMRIHALGESLPAKSGLFQGEVGVPEPSSREGDVFNVVAEDHIQICRPKSKRTRSFYGLTDLVESIVKDLTEEKAKICEETCSREETRAQEEAKIREGKSLQEEKRVYDEARNREVLVQGEMRAIEEARLRSFLQYLQSHVATAQHAQISTPIRETSEPRIRGVRVQEEKRALEEGQAQKTLKFQRHLAAADHVRISRPLRWLRSAIDSFSSEDGKYKSSMPSGAIRYSRIARQLNDTLFELYKPRGTPSMQVVFFHGLQPGEDYGDAHFSTWTSRDGDCIWPQTWLAEDFPDAHIFSVSCPGHKQGHGGRFDVDIITQNLSFDLISENIGQLRNCPVIFAGHCFGGLVIKSLMLFAHGSSLGSMYQEKNAELDKLLASVRGIYFLGTPHRGSIGIFNNMGLHRNNAFIQYLNVLSCKANRLEFEIGRLPCKYRTFGLGESLPTRLGQGPEAVLVVPEPSARYGDYFSMAEADHFDISRPNSKIDKIYYTLQQVLLDIAFDTMKEEKESKEPEEAINSKVMARL